MEPPVFLTQIVLSYTSSMSRQTSNNLKKSLSFLTKQELVVRVKGIEKDEVSGNSSHVNSAKLLFIRFQFPREQWESIKIHLGCLAFGADLKHYC